MRTRTISFRTVAALLTLLVVAATASAQTSRTWDGSSSTAWNVAANWTPSGVPATIDHVAIPSTTNKPVLSANVTVANFSITGGELDLDGHTMTVNGTMSMTGGTVKDGLMQKTTTAAVTITGVTVNCVLNIVSNTISINNSIFKQEATITKNNGGANSFNGNIWEAHTRLTNSGNHIGSSLTIASTEADTFLSHLELTSSAPGLILGNSSSAHALVLAGDGLQFLTIHSSTGLSGRRVTINKPTGHVQLTGDLVIANYLNLTKGIVEVASGGLVTVNSAATVSSTSNISHINGPVLKKGNQAFTFPVGRNGAYRPITITAPSTSTHSFRAEYFEKNSNALYSHASKDASLNHLNKNEYWTLTRVAGTSTPKVTLSWDTLTSCIMSTPLSAIHVAGWNGTTWKDLGNGATTGTAHKGTIQTTAAVTSFNAFILEHDSGMGCRDFDLTWAPDTLMIDSTSNFFLTSSNLPYYHSLSLKVEGAGYAQYHTWGGLEHIDTVIAMIHINDSIGDAEVTLYVVNQLGYEVDSLVYLIPYKRSAQEFECVCEPVECDHIANGNFKDNSAIPDGYSQLTDLVDCWGKVVYDGGTPEDDCFPIEWYCSDHEGTPDYFHINSVNPWVGVPYNTLTSIPINSVNLNENDNAYAGILAYAPYGISVYKSEYLPQRLAEPLINGRNYKVRFHLQVSNRSKYATIPGILLTDEPVCQVSNDHIDGSSIAQPHQLLTVLPNPGLGYLYDFNEWHIVELDFIASDAWNHMTIGHFTDDPIDGYTSWLTTGHDPLFNEQGIEVKQCYWFIDEVSLKPNPPVITQGAGLCRTGSPITLNVTGAGTGADIYTWSASPADASLTGQTHDMEIEVNPSAATTVYTVTVEGPDGCLLTDQITISSDYCCMPASGTTSYINATMSGTQVLSGYFAINGTMTIEPGADITFDGANVNMGPNATIIVNAGASLTVTDGSHLKACDKMWYGIFTYNGSAVTVNGGALIEDAYNALNIQSGTYYEVNDAIFNRNYVHIYLAPPFNVPVYPTTTITDNRFLCQTTASISLPTPVHANLLPPMATDMTYMGILAMNFGNLKVGSLGHGNEFDNCTVGIYASDVPNVNITDNSFTIHETTGIYVTNSGQSGGDIDIIGNSLLKMPFGIACYDNPEAEIKIEGNDITFTGMTSPPQYMTGIAVIEITPGSPPSAPNMVSIHDNDITDAPCGIKAVNLAGYLLSPSTYIGNNTIYNTKTHNDEQAGILVENCTGIIVNENVISHNSKTGYETGIRIGSGNTNWLFCNQVTDINKGLFFDNDQRPSTLLVKNVMDNNQTGIFLNNAIIGNQGTTTQALDNEWLGTYTMSPDPHNPHTETYGVDAIGTLSKFFVQSTTTTNPTKNAKTFGSLFEVSVEIENTAWPSGCPLTAPSYKQEGEQIPDLSDALNIVNPIAEPQTLRERSIGWAGQYGLYKQLLADETMRNAAESLNAFFLDRDGGNMGRLHRAMSSFNQLRSPDGSGLQSAGAEDQLGTVQGLVSEDRVEQRLAEVLSILYANIADLTGCDGTQEARLREIAQLCPLDEGFGVYIARSALLKLDTLPRHYTSECERMPDQQAIDSWKNGMEDTTHMEFSVYPNPNNGSFAINYQLNDRESGTILLFNALGEVVYQRQLDASTTAMNLAINGLSSGIYVLRVDVDGAQRLVERITVLLSDE